MYAGQEMEAAPTDAFFGRPRASRTRAGSSPACRARRRRDPRHPGRGAEPHRRRRRAAASTRAATHATAECRAGRPTPRRVARRPRRALPSPGADARAERVSVARHRAAARAGRPRPALPGAQRLRPAHRLDPRRRRRLARGVARRDAGSGRRERLRQVDARQDGDGHPRADGRRDPLRRARDRPPAASASAARVAKDLQYVYQDPGASLDPRWKIVHSLHEPLKIHTALSRAERRTRGARDPRARSACPTPTSISTRTS